MEDPVLLDEASYELVNLLKSLGLNLSGVDRVVGPAMGAITLAHDVARHISNERRSSCFRAFTEKETEDGSKTMVFKRTVILPGERTLPVEDVLTTGGSVDLMIQAVTKPGGIVLPFIAVLVNRSGLTEVSGKRVVALIDRPMPMWVADECPLCKQSSEAIRPKGTESWARLNATY
jgi:orotate phosphoribosyltransferase